jgi:hypothetical protein
MLRFNRIFVFFFEKALRRVLGFSKVCMIITMKCTDGHPRSTYPTSSQEIIFNGKTSGLVPLGSSILE